MNVIIALDGARRFLTRTAAGWDITPSRTAAHVFTNVEEAAAVRDEIAPTATVMSAERVSRTMDGEIRGARGRS